jgi:hypothetical protein
MSLETQTPPMISLSAMNDLPEEVSHERVVTFPFAMTGGLTRRCV